LLKRQGERPFKDQLTLEDYGVSNGVQLDLSVYPLIPEIDRDTNDAAGKLILATELLMQNLLLMPSLGA
jgi:hypothetical protein